MLLTVSLRQLVIALGLRSFMTFRFTPASFLNSEIFFISCYVGPPLPIVIILSIGTTDPTTPPPPPPLGIHYFI